MLSFILAGVRKLGRRAASVSFSRSRLGRSIRAEASPRLLEDNMADFGGKDPLGAVFMIRTRDLRSELNPCHGHRLSPIHPRK